VSGSEIDEAFPTVRKTRRVNPSGLSPQGEAWLRWSLESSPALILSAIARCIPDPVAFDHKLKRIWRFVDSLLFKTRSSNSCSLAFS